MSQEITFKGWVAYDKNAIGNMKWDTYQPKSFTEDDVDIQITHSGICGSDLHTLRSGWAPADYPVVVGHEIVGHAIRVGSKASHIKKGDRVGVGAQSASCLRPDCEECNNGDENHCPRQTHTYDHKYLDGSKAMGGYALYSRVPGHFVFKIPEGVKSEDAAPMMCGGVTVYSPLRNNGCGPGKKVGIVGVGGLGHFGLLFAKALGADSVTAISRTRGKEADARKMGADDFIATDEDEKWYKNKGSTLDLIVCTVSSPKLPLGQYLALLRTHGTFIMVGAPEDKLPSFNAFSLIAKGAKLGGSAIGSPAVIREMLEVAAGKKVQPWIQQRPMSEANQAVIDMENNKARYRYVLVNSEQGKL